MFKAKTNNVTFQINMLAVSADVHKVWYGYLHMQ